MPYEDDPVSLEQHQRRMDYVMEFDLDDEDFCNRHNIDNKIHWRSQETGIPEDVIRDALRANPILRWFFVMSPGRQNTGENWAAVIVPGIPGITNFNHPHPGTLNLVTVGNTSTVMTRQQLTDLNANADTRGIDFEWDYTGNHHFYGTQKHTNGVSGGSFQQDKFDEMKSWIQVANRNNSPDDRFIVLVDGSYWTDARIANLETNITQPNVFVSRVADLQTNIQNM